MENKMSDSKAGPAVIPMKRYNELLEAERKLAALEAGGVDNWEGYDFAMEGFWDEEEENG